MLCVFGCLGFVVLAILIPNVLHNMADVGEEEAPAGLAGAKWLMSSAEVRRLFPAAVEWPSPESGFETSLKLLEATHFDRPAFVDFFFRDDLLMMIIVTFKGEKTVESYGPTQTALEAAYGTFPTPTPTEDYTLASTKRFENAVVQHLLYEGMGIPIEQVILWTELGPR